MSNVVSINGSEIACPLAVPLPDKQVWGCGACQDQGHRLLPENEIICGICNAPSAFEHYEPETLRAGDDKRMPKLMQARVDKLDNFVCPRCRHNRFHLQQSGTLTCFRCRHAIAFKWWHPETGEPA